MRLIETLNDEEKAQAFSAYLFRQGIDNQCEIVTDKKGTKCHLWVYDEDQVEAATSALQTFLNDPDAVAYQTKKTESIREPKQMRSEPPIHQSLGTVTLLTLLLCIALFIASSLTSPRYEKIPLKIPPIALFSSPVDKALMYDYPESYVIIDKVVHAYGLDALQQPATLPVEGKLLLQKYSNTPYWKGFYDKIVAYFQDGTPIRVSSPMFEKISQGEVWRLFTPALLHVGLLHLFFNMIWLVVIGKQMEKRIGAFRYLLFFLIAGIVSNTAQYLMSGSNFLGFSGVICAMIVFVWVRKKYAPWEGYFLQPATWNFILFFVLFVFSLQFFAFLYEIYSHTSSQSTNLANTAHITGGVAGYILARINTFAKKR